MIIVQIDTAPFVFLVQILEVFRVTNFLIRFNNMSRTTGSTLINIDDKRLTILIATTGGKLMRNMKNWINYTGFDGSHNRFLYLSIPKVSYARPQK